MDSGKVVEIIGAVVDVQFSRQSIPKVYDALRIKENNLTLEVQQQIGDGIVRTDIAVGQTGYEFCDDGNTVSGDTCPSDCTDPGQSVCGDGIRQGVLSGEAA